MKIVFEAQNIRLRSTELGCHNVGTHLGKVRGGGGGGIVIGGGPACRIIPLA